MERLWHWRHPTAALRTTTRLIHKRQMNKIADMDSETYSFSSEHEGNGQ